MSVETTVLSSVYYFIETMPYDLLHIQQQMMVSP